ncbi:MAG: hypothetical protein H6822_19575 [Planctomycetaceae bacterium]|nr:hypothetical protein [Planctomycetales bacterium]MCB9924388.1 hypothetical protein [Planctomycetaceae bacterium]
MAQAHTMQRFWLKMLTICATLEEQNEEARRAKERERNLIEKQNEERRRAEERKAYMAELVLCPYCRGEIRRDAQKWRHCSEWVSDSGHSDMLAFFLGLVLGPVGLWYKGRFAEGFAWLAASTFYGWQASLTPGLWIGIPGFWIGMAIHAVTAKGKR